MAKNEFILEAIRLSAEGMKRGDGGPFGAVIVKDNIIIGRGWNRTFINKDATAHAEVEAIRDACKNLQLSELPGCDIYSSAEPCPMCLSAIYWSRISHLYYGNTKEDSAFIGFDDGELYKELALKKEDRKLPHTQIAHEAAKKIFEEWRVEKEGNG